MKRGRCLLLRLLLQRGRDARRLGDGLQHHAEALGQLQQLVDALLWLLGVEIEGDADVAEANRRFLVDAQGAAKVEIALDDDAAARELEVDRGGDGIQSDAGAGGQRSEEHTSELQSLMRISYAVFCLKNKQPMHQHNYTS